MIPPQLGNIYLSESHPDRYFLLRFIEKVTDGWKAEYLCIYRGALKTTGHEAHVIGNLPSMDGIDPRTLPWENAKISGSVYNPASAWELLATPLSCAECGTFLTQLDYLCDGCRDSLALQS